MSLPTYAPIAPGLMTRAVATAITRKAIMRRGVAAVCENPTRTDPRRTGPAQPRVRVRSVLVDGVVVTGVRYPNEPGEPRRDGLPDAVLLALVDVTRERPTASLRHNGAGHAELVWT